MKLETIFFFKFKSFTWVWKNFSLIVERDASGGVQMLDDVVFQIRRRYNNVSWGSHVSDIEEPMTVRMADLTRSRPRAHRWAFCLSPDGPHGHRWAPCIFKFKQA